MIKIKIRKSIIGIICVIGGIILTHTVKNNSAMNSNSNIYLLLGNIEALASNEGRRDYCVGFGSIDCNGQKAEYKVSTFSLPLYK